MVFLVAADNIAYTGECLVKCFIYAIDDSTVFPRNVVRSVLEVRSILGK